MEDDLDAIARGEQQRVEWLKEFYFGSDQHVGLRNILDSLGEIDAALERIAAGTYGSCVHCAAGIPEERLELRPYAGSCVACTDRR